MNIAPLKISGNPSDIEIAAITAAISQFLSSATKTATNDVGAGVPWHVMPRFQNSQKVDTKPVKSWTLANRLHSRL